MARVHVSLFRGQKHFASHDTWVYLGSSIQTEGALQRDLKNAKQVQIGDKLQATANRCRDEYLELISRIGIEQGNSRGWWKTQLSWKPIVSELLLLICYQEIILECAREAKSSLLVVIEDPWLFRQLQKNLPNATFESARFSLKLKVVGAFLLGLAKRLRWAVRISKSRFLQERLASQNFSLSTEGKTCFYSLPQPHCFQPNNGWRDPFFAGSENSLAEEGIETFRVAPPFVGFEKEVATRSSYCYPMILESSPWDIFASVISYYRPKLKGPIAIQGTDVSFLIKRELNLDLKLSSMADQEFFYRCVRKFFANKKPSLIMYPFENQPWEKLLVLAGKEHRVGTLGYQHATVPKFELAYYNGKSDVSFPNPDLIATSGNFTLKTLEEGGVPKSRLKNVGSLRINHSAAFSYADPKKVLVLLPLHPKMLAIFLKSLEEAFPTGGADDGIEIYLRPHPVTYQITKNLRTPFPIPKWSLAEGLEHCGTILFCSTMAGYEAWLQGRNTIRFVPDLMLNLDPCDFLSDEEMRTCTRSSLRQCLLESVAGQKTNEGYGTRSDQIFTNFDGSAWISSIKDVLGRSL
jgi:hypothetical protein